MCIEKLFVIVKTDCQFLKGPIKSALTVCPGYFGVYVGCNGAGGVR